MEARKELGDSATDKDVANLAFKRLAIAFGKKILAIVPGRVSTEVDARLSYDTEKTIEQAREIIEQYEQAGIGREHVLIKIASTWEGIRAAEVLEKEGIHCNLTLLFGLHQAIAVRRSRRNADVAVRGPHSGLVQEGHRQGLSRRGRSRRAVGDPDLQLPQEVRLQDGGDGRELPQHRRDHRAGRLRSADDLAATAGRAGIDQGELPRKLDPEKAKTMQIEKITIDKATFDAMHADRPHGQRQAEGRHRGLLGRAGQSRKAAGQAAGGAGVAHAGRGV